ncbi:hypothetical protein BKA93DRAFT_750796 [Sparassis latifolia]
MASRISFIPMTNTPYYVIAPYDDVPLSYLLNETATMTAPSIQTIHTSTVDQLLQQQESSLAKSPFFLGNPTLLNHVDWFCKDPSNDQLIVKQRTPDDPPQLADLTCIGEIGSDHYYMFPGGYNTANDKLPQGNTEFERFQYVVQSDEEQSDNNDNLSPSDKVSECSSTTHLIADETDSESRKSVTELDTEFGALVKMTINITRQHTWMNGRVADSFFADIAQITILLPPGYEDKITSSAKRHGMNLPDDVLAMKKTKV